MISRSDRPRLLVLALLILAALAGAACGRVITAPVEAAECFVNRLDTMWLHSKIPGVVDSVAVTSWVPACEED